MSSYKIIIPYTPKAKASVRTGKNGWYNPTAKGMMKSASHVRSQLPEQVFPLMKGPVLAIVHYCMPAPLSLTQWKRTLQHRLPHIKKPDGDNLEKFLNDALNGTLWDDDCKIAWLLRSKSITHEKEGKTIIYIEELSNSKPDYDAILKSIAQHIHIGE